MLAGRTLARSPVFAEAAVLTAAGLHGVLSTKVRQRPAEIGVRMALGSAPGGSVRLVAGHGMRLSAAGVFVGLVAALALTRLMTTMLLGVRSTNPSTYTNMATLFFMIAAAAAWLPARRAAASRSDQALRGEQGQNRASGHRGTSSYIP